MNLVVNLKNEDIENELNDLLPKEEIFSALEEFQLTRAEIEEFVHTYGIHSQYTKRELLNFLDK